MTETGVKKQRISTGKYIIIIVLLLSMIIGYVWESFYPTDKSDKMTAYFLDVGHGDCSLFVQGDVCILVDGGEKEYADTVIKKLKELKIRDIDCLIATHPHSDHIGSLAKVVKTVKTKSVIIPFVTSVGDSSYIYTEILTECEKSNCDVSYVKIGHTYKFDDIYLTALSPEREYENMNDNSIVAYLSFGKTDFMLTGDCGYSVEKNIIDTYENIECEILKVGHHGSAKSSSEDFIKYISPQVAVLSVEKDNKYNLPSNKTLELLEKYGCDIYRTDFEGTVKIECDSESYKIITNH